jgi:hypothetical protein
LSCVVFGPTLECARRAGRALRDSLPASPKSDRALDEALADGRAVRFCAPTANTKFWSLVRRRYWLPAVPALLRAAIGGIARHSAKGEPGRASRDEPDQDGSEALWIEGKLSDARAKSLLSDSRQVRLWVIEDFRKLKVSDSFLARIEGAGIRITALRGLRASMLKSRG